MDNTVFSNNPPPKGNNPPPEKPQDQGPRVTIDDLYGPSTPQTPQPVQQQSEPSYAPQPDQQPMQPVQSMTPSQQSPQSPIEEPHYDDVTEAAPVPFWKNPKIKLFGGIGIILLCVLFILIFISSKLNANGGIGGKVTLTYWGLWEDSKTMSGILKSFEEKNPTIHIEYTRQDSKKYKDRLLTRINNNTGPDIVTYHNSWVPTMTDVLLPLPNDVITPDEIKKDYFPVVQKDIIFNGALYGIPQGMDTLALFINKEIFDAAGLQTPQTWDDFIKAAKSLTVKDEDGKIKTAGAALGTIDNINHASDVVSLMLVQNAVNLQKMSLFEENIKDALTFYTTFAYDNENVWDETLNPSLLAFSNGELAMTFGYSWDIFQIKAANPSLAFEVYPVPNLPGRKATIASYWVNGVSSKSTHQKESFLFMKYLAQKDVQQKLYTESTKVRLFGTPYARMDLAKTLEDNALVYPFVQQASFAQSTFFASDTKDSNYNDRLNAYLGNAIRSIASGSTPETAIKTLIDGVSQVRSQYGL